ncbi:MAG TPA: NDP-sugar synthase [Peptococcaceae bacterium]|nr:NDP-sugar synthase [Peptococcaceae bacterium]
MKAMIMAAGTGTRLRPLTNPLPKPMVPVLNTPVMEYSVKLLKKHGITDIIANTHYNPHYICNYFQQGEDLGVYLQYSYEPKLLGTAGGVKNNRHFLDETFFILSGDALTDINLTAMYNFHKKRKALVTIALKPFREVSQYGVVVTETDGRIVAFQEKPRPDEALSNVVNTGIYLMEPEIFQLIPDGYYDFGRELFPKLIDLKLDFYGYVTEDYWCDIGSPAFYQQAQVDALQRPSLKENAAKDGVYLLHNSCLTGINSTLDLSTILGQNVFIGRNCVIGSNVYLNNCVIWDNCILMENAVVENAVIASNCQIGANAFISEGTLVGSNAVIGRNTILKNCSIEPNSIMVSGKADLA